MIGDDKDDQLYWQACQFVISGGRPSITVLQRRFKVGFYQAESWIRRMEENGILKVPPDRLH
jgi:S-DNA-T family DNA segregation ATPase FtsK/SpoIIIE